MHYTYCFNGLNKGNKMSKRTSPIWKVSKEEFALIVKKATTMSEILKEFGLYNKGGNYKTLRQRLKEDNIDYSHIPTGIHAGKGRSFGGVKAKPLKEILVKDSNYQRKHLKKRLIKENLLDYKCQKCGLETEWQGEKLVLVLDHINGVPDDNRLENLRFLCPNCNSQTPTFAGRKVVDSVCIKCGKKSLNI